MTPRPIKRILTGCISLILLAMYITSLTLIESNRQNFSKTKNNVGVWNLPPIALSALSCEFKGIMADLLILEASARVGTKVERNADGEPITVTSDYSNQTIYEILSASQSLDPTFQQTFMLAQGWLPWNDGMVSKTIKLLEISQENRPWDFFPTQFMAFNTYYFLDNYVLAGKILLKAAGKENAPAYFGILGSRLSHKGGNTEAAISLLETVMVEKKPEDPGYKDLQVRLKALEGTLIIEQAVSRYRHLFLKLPEEPNQLVSSGTIQQLPANPYNLQYCIDMHGKVYFDRPYCRENPTQNVK